MKPCNLLIEILFLYSCDPIEFGRHVREVRYFIDLPFFLKKMFCVFFFSRNFIFISIATKQRHIHAINHLTLLFIVQSSRTVRRQSSAPLDWRPYSCMPYRIFTSSHTVNSPHFHTENTQINEARRHQSIVHLGVEHESARQLSSYEPRQHANQ